VPQVTIRATLRVETPADRWQRLSSGDGAKGPRWDDWYRLPLVPPLQEGFERWCLVRRSQSDPDDLQAYVVFAPAGTPLADLVRVGGSRWTIADAFEAANGEVGVAKGPVTAGGVPYHSAAHAPRPSGKSGNLPPAAPGLGGALDPPLTVPEVRRLLWGVVLRAFPSVEHVLDWSAWRRHHQAVAKRCHYRRRHPALTTTVVLGQWVCRCMQIGASCGRFLLRSFSVRGDERDNLAQDRAHLLWIEPREDMIPRVTDVLDRDLMLAQRLLERARLRLGYRGVTTSLNDDHGRAGGGDRVQRRRRAIERRIALRRGLTQEVAHLRLTLRR
jgi:hypothetical protein